MSVTIFTAGCRSSRKAKDWLNKYGISYNERNVNRQPITVKEIKQVLQLTDEGTDQIISRRSNAYERLQIDFDTISLPDTIQLLYENPGLIRFPIIMDERRLQIGFKEEEISQFMPREYRQKELIKLRNLSYQNSLLST